MKKYVFTVLSILLIYSLVAFNQQHVNQTTSSIDTKAILDSKSDKDNNYFKKEVYSLEDIEKLLKVEKISAVKQGQIETDFNRLQQKNPTEYFIDNDNKQVLRMYVFDTENERISAKSEYDVKTQTINMSYRKIYEVKNIMLFLIAGDISNQYYETISKLTQKMQ